MTNKVAHGARSIGGYDTLSGRRCRFCRVKKIPLRKRPEVKTVTTDLSSAMMLTVHTALPAASLINDRFHVQQLISEAIDWLRIRHRWKVLNAEHKAIK